jgi:hypothetical protein
MYVIDQRGREQAYLDASAAPHDMLADVRDLIQQG